MPISVSEFAENLAYDINQKFGDNFKTWLNEDRNRNKGTEAKVKLFINHTTATITGTSMGGNVEGQPRRRCQSSQPHRHSGEAQRFQELCCTVEEDSCSAFLKGQRLNLVCMCIELLMRYNTHMDSITVFLPDF